MLRAEQVSNAIKRGVNQKIADGHNLYLVVKNGKGFWVYQFRDGNVIRSRGLGSAGRVTLAQARRAREAFAVARREGLELPGVRSYTPRGDKFAVAADATSQTMRTNGVSAIGPGSRRWCECTPVRSPRCR